MDIDVLQARLLCFHPMTLEKEIEEMHSAEKGQCVAMASVYVLLLLPA